MPHDVFISYSTKNREAAETVVAELENAGIKCWIAPRDILPGTPYGEAIVKAIESCQVFVLILSKASNQSRQVLREIDHASSTNAALLPFLIENIQLTGAMTYYLGPEQWLDATSPPLEAHSVQLADNISRLIGSQTTPSKVEDHPHFIPRSEDQEARERDQILQAGKKAQDEGREPTYSINVNPFTFGNPVSTRERFFGRHGEIRQIISRLLSAGESTSVVGERRIGKTSLLKFVANPDNAHALGLAPEKYCLVYIDFQGLTDITPQRFWQQILRKMEKIICRPELDPVIQSLHQNGTFDLFDLEDLFECISSEGMTTVLLMDEFEYVTRNPNFESDFFGGLRALAIHRDLTLITGTRRELVDLCHSDEIKGSPFFNIFVNLVLRPFSEDVVIKMLKGYTSETDINFDSTDLKTIFQLSGGYPFFVQMAGYYLIEAKWKGLAPKAALEELIEQFKIQAEPHFSYFWSNSSESEKITLLAVLLLSRQQPSPKTHPTIENLAKIRSKVYLDVPELIKRGLLIRDKKTETYSVFSSSFEDWISREIAAVSGQEESEERIEEWIKDENIGEVEGIQGLLASIKKRYWPLFRSVVSEEFVEMVSSTPLELISQARG